MDQNHSSESLVSNSQWADDVTEVYKKLSDEEKNYLLQKLMHVSSFTQLYFLQDNLQKIKHRDFMILLPKEMIERILDYLDFTSLCRCCQVSTHWNSMILSFAKIWRNQCIKFGLCLSEKTMQAINSRQETYKELRLRMAKKLQQMKICNGFENLIYEGHSKRVTAVHYWNEKLATGTSNGELILWDIQTDQLLHKTLIPNFCITCLSFNDEVLVTSSATGYFCILDATTLNPLRKFGGIPGAIFALDFNFSLNIVVSGSADSLIRLWSLTTGHLIDILHGHSHWVGQVILRPSVSTNQCPVQFQEADAILVSADKERILVWSIKMHDNACKKHVISVIQLSGRFTPGIYFDGWQLCYIDQGSYGTSGTKLCKYDLLTNSAVGNVEIPTRAKVLLGGGQKYLCLLTHCEYNNFFILDVTNWKEIASWSIPPSRAIAPGHPQISFNCTEWIHGFDGFNNNGLIMSVGLEDGAVLVTKWRK